MCSVSPSGESPMLSNRSLIEGEAIQPSGSGRRGMEPHRVYGVKRVQAFLVDETYVKVGSFGSMGMDRGRASPQVHPWSLPLQAPEHPLVAEMFLKSLVKRYGKHVVYSDGGPWYPDACNVSGLEHRLHSPYEKSLMERANEYVKDRIEEFDDYWPCLKGPGCDLRHVWNWLNLFIDIHYARRRHMTFRDLVRFLSRR
jgi:putative transposase